MAFEVLGLLPPRDQTKEPDLKPTRDKGLPSLKSQVKSGRTQNNCKNQLANHRAATLWLSVLPVLWSTVLIVSTLGGSVLPVLWSTVLIVSTLGGLSSGSKVSSSGNWGTHRLSM